MPTEARASRRTGKAPDALVIRRLGRAAMNIEGELGLSTVAMRQPLLDVTAANSGATLEVVKLADGRRLVLKHLPPEGDWLTRATDGVGRVRRLWESDVLRRIDPIVDHTILEVRTVDDHGTVIIMRDARDDLLPSRSPISRGTARDLLSRLASMHDTCEGTWSKGFCAIENRYAMMAPAFHAGDTGPNPHRRRQSVVHGWQLFERHVDIDVVSAVFAVHRDPGAIGRRLGEFKPTLLHGDAKLENLGLSSERLVAVDWGELTGFGPREIDVAWFALMGASRIGCMPDEIFADYEAASARPFALEALDLACIGSLAQMGFQLAITAFTPGSESLPGAAQLSWWVDRVRVALNRLGSI